LAFLHEEISKLQDQLKQLEKDRASLLSYRTRHCAILSPLRGMPLEVLGEIFSWTLPSLSDALDWGRFDMTDSPWVLTQISSGWSLERNFPLYPLLVVAGRHTSSTYSLSLVAAQIQRSQNLKNHFYGCNETDFGLQIQMFQFLAQHSSRWEEFSLGLTSELLPSLAALRDRVSSLRRLWIEWDGSEIETVESINCFQTASSLVNVGVYNGCRVLPITLRMHQLTGYQLDGPLEMHRGIWELAPNLVEARIALSFDDR
jgi:hypothetical protein